MKMRTEKRLLRVLPLIFKVLVLLCLISLASILRNKKNRRDEDYLIKKTIEVLNEISEQNEKDNGYLDPGLEDLPVDLLKHCEVILNEYPDLTDESILSTGFTNLICSTPIDNNAYNIIDTNPSFVLHNSITNPEFVPREHPPSNKLSDEETSAI